MKKFQKNVFKRMLAGLLVLPVIFAILTVSIPAGDSEKTAGVLTASAASTVEEDYNHNLVQTMVDYLGYGYSQTERYGETGCYDCSSLVMKVLNQNGVYNTPWYTGAWVDQIAGHSLCMTYNGTSLSYVYCSSITEYQAAINNSANVGKVIVLTSLTGLPSLEEKGLLYPGTLEVYSGHIAMVVGTVPTENQSMTSSYSTFNQARYGYAAYKYLSDNYTVPVPLVQVWDDVTTASVQKEVSAGGSFTLRSTSAFKQVGGASAAAYNSVQDVSPKFTGYAGWAKLLVTASRDDTNAYGDGRVWRLEGFSDYNGVLYSNYNYGPKKESNKAYLVYFNQPTAQHYYSSLKLKDTGTKSTSSYVTGAVYALVDSSVSASAAMSCAQTAASKTSSQAAINYAGSTFGSSLAGIFTVDSSAVWLQTVTKSGSTYTAGSTALLDLGTSKTGSASKSYRLVEIWVPEDYVRDANCYTLKLTSTNPLSIAGPAYNLTTVSVSRTKGTADNLQTNSNTLTASKGFLTTVNAPRYYYALDVYSKLPENAFVGGAKYKVGLTYDASTGTLADVIAVVTTASGARSSLFSGYASKNSKKTFYIIETGAADGCEKNCGYWKITMTGATDGTGKASVTTGAVYYPQRKTTTGVALSLEPVGCGYSYTDGYYSGYLMSGGTAKCDALLVINHPNYVKIYLKELDWTNRTTPVIGSTLAVLDSTSESEIRALATGTSSYEDVEATGKTVMSLTTKKTFTSGLTSIGADSTATFYITEISSADGYSSMMVPSAKTGTAYYQYWQVTYTGSDAKNGVGAQIKSVYYYRSEDGVTWTAHKLSTVSGYSKGYYVDDTTDELVVYECPVSTN